MKIEFACPHASNGIRIHSRETRPTRCVAISFYCSVREISEFTRPHVIRFVASYFFHSEKRIQKYPDSLPNLPDARGRKRYADTTCGRDLAIAFFEQKEDQLKQRCELNETIIYESNTSKTI